MVWIIVAQRGVDVRVAFEIGSVMLDADRKEMPLLLGHEQGLQIRDGLLGSLEILLVAGQTVDVLEHEGHSCGSGLEVRAEIAGRGFGLVEGQSSANLAPRAQNMLTGVYCQFFRVRIVKYFEETCQEEHRAAV